MDTMTTSQHDEEQAGDSLPIARVSVARRIRNWAFRLIHFPVTTRTTDTMDAWGSKLVTEYEVLNRRGKVIGYWAYGSFDPSLPYKGDECI